MHYWCLNRHLCGLLEGFGKKTYWSGVSQKLAGVSRRVYLKIRIVKVVSRDIYCEGCILRYVS